MTAARQIDWTRLGPFLLKFAYYGGDYFGLAAQSEAGSAAYAVALGKRRRREDDERPALVNGGRLLPTIEATIEKALCKANLAKSLVDAGCSRCGRTDRGVHARGNYLTLQLRLKPRPRDSATAADDSAAATADDSAAAPGSLADLLEDTAQNPRFYDYAAILNGILPASIRVIWVKSCPVWLDARFHCLFRMYRYYFARTSDLDLQAMHAAGQQLVGTHDFKNFCKVDPAADKTTIRQICVCAVRPVSETVGVLFVTGPAFLWHQVRCIVGVLTAIGRGTLPRSCVSEWLDLVRTPTKPPYLMAPPEGLVLWDCAFEGLPLAPPQLLPSAPLGAPPAAAEVGARSTAAFRRQAATLDVQLTVVECLATAADEEANFLAA